MMKRVLIVMAMAILAGTAGAGTVYVTPTGTSSGGVTPIYDSIQDAIDAAEPGDEVRIAAGVYDEITTKVSQRNISAPVELSQIAYIGKPLLVRGGYNEAFTDRDPALHETILDANGNARGVMIEGEPGYISDPADLIDVHISGLTVREGHADEGGDSSYSRRHGGGLQSEAADLRIDSCRFLNNQTYADGADERQTYGGAIYSNDGRLSVRDSHFEGNVCRTEAQEGWSFAGGGAVAAGGFYPNRISAGAGLRIEGCTFVGNSTDNGDGGAVWAGDSLTYLRNNHFEGNTAGRRGGAAHIMGIEQVNPEGIFSTVRENDFSGNTADEGGALSLQLARGKVFLNDFEGNEATGVGGGAIAVIQNGYEYHESVTPEQVIIENNRFAGNDWTGSNPVELTRGGDAIRIAAREGETLYTSGDGGIGEPGGATPYYVAVRHNTIHRGVGAGTAAIVLSWRRARLENNLISNHTVGICIDVPTTVTGEGSYAGDFEIDHTLFANVGTAVKITDGAATETASVSVADALLDSDGLHLLEGSPAIDAGADSDVNYDYDGQYRPAGMAPDIGADESGTAPPMEQLGRLELTARHPYYYRRSLEGGGYDFRLIQEYVALIDNDLTSASFEDYMLTQQVDADLGLEHQGSWPEMDYDESGGDHIWASTTELAAQDRGVVQTQFSTTSWTPGEVLDSTAQLNYTPAGGSATQVDDATSSTAPFVIPYISSPGHGEILPPIPGEDGIEVEGIGQPGATIAIYEDDTLATTTTAGPDGVFVAHIDGTVLLTNGLVTLTAVDETQVGNPSPPSRGIEVELASNPWCPQRSTWTIVYDVRGTTRTFVYRFRDTSGRYSTNDWIVPRLAGQITHSELNLIAWCHGDGAAPTTVTLTVETTDYPAGAPSGTPPVFTMATGPMSPGDTLKIAVACADELSISVGEIRPILIDPDGYVYDARLGLDLSDPEATVLPGTRVTCMEWTGTAWIRWPAELYEDQINPQVVGEDGYFAFFTPPGLYYLIAEDQPGYQDWRSYVVEVIDEIVHVNIPLTPETTEQAAMVALSPGDGGDALPEVTIGLGESVQWASTAQGLGLAAVSNYLDHPVVRMTSDLPAEMPLGWDSGMLEPGESYERTFYLGGTYPYADGLGRTGTVVVQGSPTSSTATFEIMMSGPGEIRVTYDAEMGASALDASRYTLSGSGQGTLAAHPDSVTTETQGLATVYVLTWNSGSGINGETATITIAGVTDAGGDPIVPPNATESTMSVPVGLSSFEIE